MCIERIPVSGAAHGLHAGIGRDQPQFHGSIATSLAQGGPASVIAASILVDDVLGCLQRNMVGLKTQVGKKRFAVLPVGGDVFHGFIDNKSRGIIVFGQVHQLAIFEPGCLIVHRRVRPLFPVIGAAVSLDK
ncbi:hypothetical protein D3C84_503710 [compost metagenome]